MTTAFGLIAIAGYLMATAMLGFRLKTPHSPGFASGSAVSVTTAVGLACHGFLLYQVVLAENGLNLDFFNTASLVAWAVVVTAMLATAARPLDSVAVVVLPVASLVIALSLGFGGEHLLTNDGGPGREAHIVSSILAYSLFALAAVQAVMLAYQEHQLRKKRFGGLLRVLPPLQTQETLMFQMIGFGFFLLSLSLMSGIMFLGDNIFAQHLAHKTILSVVSWLVFAVLLFGRWRYGWRGRTAVKFCLFGFLILVLAYFGSKAVLEVLLGRDWRVS